MVFAILASKTYIVASQYGLWRRNVGAVGTCGRTQAGPLQLIRQSFTPRGM